MPHQIKPDIGLCWAEKLLYLFNSEGTYWLRFSGFWLGYDHLVTVTVSFYLMKTGRASVVFLILNWNYIVVRCLYRLTSSVGATVFGSQHIVGFGLCMGFIDWFWVVRLRYGLSLGSYDLKKKKVKHFLSCAFKSGLTFSIYIQAHHISQTITKMKCLNSR